MTAILLLTLLDGSVVNLKVDAKTEFTVATQYGTLKVPAAQLLACDLGVHVDNAAEFVDHAKALGDGKWKTRDEASKWLAARARGAYKYVLPLAKHDDPEVATRAEALLKAMPVVQINDEMSTMLGKFSGTITDQLISGGCDTLGSLTVKVSSIRSIKTRTPPRLLRVDGDGKWVDVGYVTGGVNILATGEVELWPSSPGQYQVGPNGYHGGAPGTNNAQIGGHNGGALLGRIGTSIFLVGENFTSENVGAGMLQLRVNGSPWSGGGTPTGHYDVSVK